MNEVATSAHFKENAHEALTDARLQGALGFSRNFVGRRAAAVARLPEFDALRDSARAIKDHTLAHLDLYLEAYERKVEELGGHVHFARDAAEARRIFLDLCKARGAKAVTKGKSMIAEEIGLNAAMEAEGIEAIETDLGEYIIQLRGEAPSHIIAPAIHVTKADVEADFRRVHRDLPAARDLSQPEQLLGEARGILRDKFLTADIGITGANFLVAETGTSIIVTNEGNGDLTQILPKVHVVVASLEKIVPTLPDAAQILRVLARSATASSPTRTCRGCPTSCRCCTRRCGCARRWRPWRGRRWRISRSTAIVWPPAQSPLSGSMPCTATLPCGRIRCVSTPTGSALSAARAATVGSTCRLVAARAGALAIISRCSKRPLPWRRSFAGSKSIR